jgi:membrane protein DedA with SNARE-associated domain
MIVRILIGLYLAFGLFAVAVVIIDPSDDPLSAVFLAIAAMPWTLALSWLVERVGELPVWLTLTLLSIGVLVNAAVCYGLGTLLGRLRAAGKHE